MPNMPMHSYSLAPGKILYIKNLADQSLWTTFWRRTRILNETQANVTGTRTYVSIPHSNCDFWLIVNEWIRVAFITAKHSGNFGTCGADCKDSRMLCYKSRSVRFVFFCSLRSIVKFATNFCDSTSQPVSTAIHYTHSSVVTMCS
jgi:hypothetical protein